MNLLNHQMTPDRVMYPLRVLQIGGGNFIRGFIDWMIDILNEEAGFEAGVAVVKPRETGAYEALRSQDGLFYTVLKGMDNGVPVESHRLITCIQEIVNPYREWQAFLRLAEVSTMRYVVSNTTESGIRFEEEPRVVQVCPKTFPGKMTAWLHHRYHYFNGAIDRSCVFLPLELIQDNGVALKACVVRYAEYWDLEAGFIKWLDDQVFCNTLVDRIVSGYHRDDAARLSKTQGVEDRCLVVGEWYHSWIIAGIKTLKEELPLDQTGLNLNFVDDIQIHRMIKVRILNGAHIAMVALGYFRGLVTVGEAIVNPELRQLIMAMLSEEVVPTIGHDQEVLEHYVSSVIDRLNNPFIEHRLYDISLNAISKFKERLVPTLMDYYHSKGQWPRRIVFAWAVLVCYYRGSWRGQEIALRDNPEVIEIFQRSVNCHGSNTLAFVRDILSQSELWGRDFSDLPQLAETMTQNIAIIDRQEPWPPDIAH